MGRRRASDNSTVMGDRIKELREKRRFTQAELSQKLEIHITEISYFETGQRFPTSKNLIKLADVLGCSLDYLVGRELDMKSAGPDVDELVDCYTKIPRPDHRKALLQIAKVFAGEIHDARN